MHNGNGKHAKNVNEKPKNFMLAMKRLFKELKDFKLLITISLILAALGSILSIISPDMLSDLTDEISEGLVVNVENLETITKNITTSFNEDELENIMAKILELDISDEKINKINSSNKISNEDKKQFLAFLQSEDPKNEMALLPESILKEILNDSRLENNLITVEDKITLIKSLNETKDNMVLPASVQKVILKDFKIEGKTISVEDQIAFINVMSDVKDIEDANLLYEKIDQLPETIQDVIKPFMDMNTIKEITYTLIGIYLLSALFTYIESISMTDVANKFAKKLRGNISTKINKLPLKYFDNHATGDVLSRVTNDVDTIAQSMNQSLATLVSATTLFIGSILMMFWTNWIMALTAIVSSLIGFVFTFIILGKSQKYFIARQVELGNLNGHIEEVYSGLNVVKVYNGKNQADEKFDELNKRVYECNRKSQFLSGLMQPLMGFVGNFGYVAVCIVGALLTMNDLTTFGVIVAFIMYVRLFTSPLTQIAQAMTSLQSTAAASERVFDFVDEEEMVRENITKQLDKTKVKGHIEFKNVSFKYDGNENPTIKGFTAEAMPGQKIAIVGPTGAGKTTMVNLLMKFYDITSGEILIDGISTKDLSRENIHDLFTMVLQDTWLFNGTIKENIIYNRDNVSDEKVKEVCDTVGLTHFIKTLPNGFDSEVSDNESVSAGQRQLLTIARGMIQDSPFLILDEATSNVDTRTEELVQIAMDKLTEGKTSFIIAHRLSTIKNADLILVMKEGDIIEAGNHDELMNKKGFYADLYNSQFEV